MSRKSPIPGISRAARLSDEGLERLDKQLNSGQRISAQVLRQWIKKYGNSAREIINKYNPEDTDS